jgi:predicted transposase/invertase (TIGR01784 family)
MILGIDPKVDYAFKHVFGRETTRLILMDVIDSVLNPAPGHRLRNIDLLNPFNPKETSEDKLSILDIKARDESGRQFNVEMQMLAFAHYEKRIVYYGAKLYQQQLHQGEDYQSLRPTISISFLDHVRFREVPDYHLRFRLLEEAHHLSLTEDLEFHILELPKFPKSAEELTSRLDIWLYFLRHAAKMDSEALPAALAQDPLVLRAVEELNMLTQCDEERERYEARRKAQLDYNTGMKAARLQGEREGQERGERLAHVEEKISAIHFCERLLERPQTPRERLASLSLEELTRLQQELQDLALKKA